MAINTNSNGYTFGYAFVMTLLVAGSLALTATGLKPLQDKAVALDKKMQILGAVAPISDKEEANAEYDKRIIGLVIDKDGKESSAVQAFDLNIGKEYRKKKEGKEYHLPLYIYKKDDGSQTYIMPVHGTGLWDAVWGFIALDGDLNTVNGATFAHAKETPGLGAEIEKEWFQSQFIGKKLGEGDTYKLDVLKGKGNRIEGETFKVDGMSGATITGEGVEDMIQKGFDSYLAYFKTKK